MIGIIEEVEKIVVVAYFLRGKKEKYILNVLLIGAAVGTGCAVFESAGYAFNVLKETKMDSMMIDLI